jgi:hypothetical protein
MPSVAASLVAAQDPRLERLSRSGNSLQKVAFCGKIPTLVHQGLANSGNADQMQISRPSEIALRAPLPKAA